MRRRYACFAPAADDHQAIRSGRSWAHGSVLSRGELGSSHREGGGPRCGRTRCHRMWQWNRGPGGRSDHHHPRAKEHCPHDHPAAERHNDDGGLWRPTVPQRPDFGLRRGRRIRTRAPGPGDPVHQPRSNNLRVVGLSRGGRPRRARASDRPGCTNARWLPRRPCARCHHSAQRRRGARADGISNGRGNGQSCWIGHLLPPLPFPPRHTTPSHGLGTSERVGPGHQSSRTSRVQPDRGPPGRSRNQRRDGVRSSSNAGRATHPAAEGSTRSPAPDPSTERSLDPPRRPDGRAGNPAQERAR